MPRRGGGDQLLAHVGVAEAARQINDYPRHFSAACASAC